MPRRFGRETFPGRNMFIGRGVEAGTSSAISGDNAEGLSLKRQGQNEGRSRKRILAATDRMDRRDHPAAAFELFVG